MDMAQTRKEWSALDHLSHGLSRLYPFQRGSKGLESVLKSAAEQSECFARLIDEPRRGSGVAAIMGDLAMAGAISVGMGYVSQHFGLDPHWLGVPTAVYLLSTAAHTTERAGVGGEHGATLSEYAVLGGYAAGVLYLGLKAFEWGMQLASRM